MITSAVSIAHLNLNHPSPYPHHKLIFDKNGYRTKEVNPVLELIAFTDKASRGSKKKKVVREDDLSGLVEWSGEMSNFWEEDLKLIGTV